MSCLVSAMGHITRVLVLVLVAGQSVAPALAFVNEQDFTRRAPVSETVLASMRGGFQSSLHGPLLSFGIERSVFLNGQLISSTVLTIPDVAKILTNAHDTITLVHHGSGNRMSHDVSALPPLTTVIQNSLDHQAIQSHTVLNATVQALTLARSLDLGNALSLANLNAIRH